MTLTTQFITMLTMIGMGCAFGASLDTYNRFLKRSKRKSWLVFINDVFFWLLQGLAIFYILFLVNLGEIRFYVFIALLCGFAAYQALLKEIYLRLLEIIITMVISIYRFFLKLFHLMIYKPIQGIIMTLISIVLFLGRGCISLLKIVYKIVLFILKIIVLPVKWTAVLLWKVLPKNIKIKVEKLYNRLAGLLLQIKKYVFNQVSKWKKK